MDWPRWEVKSAGRVAGAQALDPLLDFFLEGAHFLVEVIGAAAEFRDKATQILRSQVGQRRRIATL